MVVKARHKDNIDDNTPEGQAYNRAYFPNLYKQLLREEVIEVLNLLSLLLENWVMIKLQIIY